MDKLVIRRIAARSDGVFGVAIWNNLPFAVTLERAWRNNLSSISCIPAGTYRAVRCNKSPSYGFMDSPKFGNTFEITNVPGRTKILFHKGNLDDDTRGCVLVGEQYGYLRGEPAILASGHAFSEFKALTKGIDEFEAGIEDCTGGYAGDNYAATA